MSGSAGIASARSDARRIARTGCSTEAIDCVEGVGPDRRKMNMRVFRHEERDPSISRLLQRAVLVVAALGASACAGRGGPVPYEPTNFVAARRSGRSRSPTPRSRSARSTSSTSTSSRSNRCPASSRSMPGRQDRLPADRHRPGAGPHDRGARPASPRRSRRNISSRPTSRSRSRSGRSRGSPSTARSPSPAFSSSRARPP